MYDVGQIVRSLAGHDKQGLFCVIGAQGEHLLLADGKRRKVSRPKRKKPGHVTPLAGPDEFDHPAIRKLKQGEPVSDRELRQALATFKGGNHTWQKTI